MRYEGDSLLPMIQEEMQQRLTRFQGLSAEEESALLSLNADQRQIVSDNDRKAKNEFLGQAPQISHGTLKEADAYKDYMAMVQAATKWSKIFKTNGLNFI